ncbi:zf-HC2 domain-containing protein, partial [Kitasatospora nipponensis]|uniref:zf-HC2 domain-containing protein n=1 Tax=Kitasatospora nipponensis TaxID=258049 RepID=UPI0031D51D98
MTHQAPEPVESAAAASHPSVDRLADLQEGLLPAAEAAELHAHLTHCEPCAQTLAALDALTELLAEDEPEPMPEAVALRLDAALAAEAALLAAGAAPTPTAPGTTVPSTPASATPSTTGAPKGAPRPAGAAPPCRPGSASHGPGRAPGR